MSLFEIHANGAPETEFRCYGCGNDFDLEEEVEIELEDEDTGEVWAVSRCPECAEREEAAAERSRKAAAWEDHCEALGDRMREEGF